MPSPSPFSKNLFHVPLAPELPSFQPYSHSQLGLWQSAEQGSGGEGAPFPQFGDEGGMGEAAGQLWNMRLTG